MLETVIQNVLSGTKNQPAKKDTSADGNKTDFQDLLAAAKDSPKTDKTESDVQKPDVPKEPQESKNPGTDEETSGQAEALLLFYGMPQILQAPDTNEKELPVKDNAEVKAVQATEVLDTLESTELPKSIQQDGKTMTVTEDKTAKAGSEAKEPIQSQQEPEGAETKQKPVQETLNAAAQQGEGIKQPTEQKSDSANIVTAATAADNVKEGKAAKETEMPETTTVAAYLQKDYAIQQPRQNETPAQVHVNEAHPEEMTKDISDVIAKSIQNGKQEFEIQLEPLHLGKLAIKVTYEAGKAAVSIICSSTKTLEAMAQNAKEIGAILDYRLGTETRIVVEHPDTDYLNQQNQQNQQEPNSQEEQSQSRQEQNTFGKEKAGQADFLQQLRLGLV